MVTCSLLAYAALWDQLAAPSVYKEQEIELGISTASCKSQEERWRHLSSAFEKTKEIQTLILSDSKFWKFSQHKESTVSIYSDFITWLRPKTFEYIFCIAAIFISIVNFYCIRFVWLGTLLRRLYLSTASSLTHKVLS